VRNWSKTTVARRGERVEARDLEFELHLAPVADPEHGG
jgi:hypothetical protein